MHVERHTNKTVCKNQNGTNSGINIVSILVEHELFDEPFSDF